MTPSQQIESLERELLRLDAMLADDETFAALRQIERRAATGDLAPRDAAAITGGLEAALADNPVFQTRRRIAEAISLLTSPESADGSAPAQTRRAGEPGAARPPRTSLADRIAMIEPMQRGEVFRTRVTLKPQNGTADPCPPAAPAAVSAPAVASPPAEPIVEVAATAPAKPPAPKPPVDDLTSIRGIDPETARRLAAASVSTFAVIAGWRRADVKAIAKDLGLGKRISRECWIEQAAILATGASTAYSRSRPGFGVVVPPPLDAVPPAKTVAVGSVLPEAIAATQAQAATSSVPAHPATAASTVPAPATAHPSTPTIPEPAAPSQQPKVDARTLALFERSSWQAGPRSLQAAVMAAEAAVQQRAAQHQSNWEPPPRASTAVAGQPVPAQPARPDPPAAHAAPKQQPEPTDHQSGTKASRAPEVPPPPPTPYRPPVTEFGRMPHEEVDLGDIVRGLRQSSDDGESEPDVRVVRDFDGDLLDLYGEEAKVEIVARQPRPKPETRAAEEAPRLLPVRPKLAPGSPPRVEVQVGDVHEAYRGIVMEASVDIIHFDEEGRRIPKTAPE